jgi:hypothetical protein
MLGRPLLGQRVTDLLAVTRVVERGRRVVMAARGAMTVPALFAAAVEQRIHTLYLAGGPPSYRSIIEREEYSEPFGNFLFDVLRHTDLPQLAGSIVAPRRVIRASEDQWDAEALAGL